jgi:hypothetical protein
MKYARRRGRKPTGYDESLASLSAVGDFVLGLIKENRPLLRRRLVEELDPPPDLEKSWEDSLRSGLSEEERRRRLAYVRRRWKEVSITRALKELEAKRLVKIVDGEVRLDDRRANLREEYRRVFARETEWILEPGDHEGAAAHLRVFLEETLVFISKTMPATREWPSDLSGSLAIGEPLAPSEKRDLALRDRIFERVGISERPKTPGSASEPRIRRRGSEGSPRAGSGARKPISPHRSST